MKLFLRKIIPLFLLVLISSGCTGKNTEPVSETAFYLGTIVKISIYSKAPEGIFEKAFSLINRYENKLSRNIAESEISEINSNAGTGKVQVSEDTFDLIEKGIKYSGLSGGRFDISIGPLVSLWGIGTENARVPGEDEIIKSRGKTDYTKILLNREHRTVMLTEEGMAIDCGAIAKGFIADRVLELLESEGVESAIINLGGNILTLGSKPGGILFRIGVQDPSDTRGEYIGIAELDGKSLVTSGIYERYFEQDGVRYHHILDPDTGYPVDNHVTGISVLTDKSVDGDALSTTFFAMGIEQGLEYASSDDNIEVLFVSDDNRLYMTDGFKNIFTLKNHEYSIAE